VKLNISNDGQMEIILEKTLLFNIDPKFDGTHRRILDYTFNLHCTYFLLVRWLLFYVRNVKDLFRARRSAGI